MHIMTKYTTRRNFNHGILFTSKGAYGASQLHHTKLRDDYPSLDELCSSLCVNADDIKSKLASIDYSYDAEKNRFV